MSSPIAPGMEPMVPSEAAIDRSDLPDLVQDLERKAALLAGGLNPITTAVLEEHMRVINSYYSNLIEGNATHPRDIRRAMAGDLDKDPAKRDLQLESRAHITTQAAFAGRDLPPDYLLSAACLGDLHAAFYAELPASLRSVSGPDGRRLDVLPGQFRTGDELVDVGNHLAPAPEFLEHLLLRFSQAYRFDQLRGQKRIIGIMAAHHRLAWIHPFLDGNGRVGRLLTDFLLKAAGIGGCGVWCLSRGLAKHNRDYKAALALADYRRQDDMDGRGQLSEAKLVAFCDFMLKTAIDQVEFMTGVLKLGGMSERIRAYLRARNDGLVKGAGPIKPEASRLIERAFIQGEFARKDMAEIAGLDIYSTRRLVKQLKDDGLLTETSSRSPLRWAVPEHAERYLLPELAPPA